MWTTAAAPSPTRGPGHLDRDRRSETSDKPASLRRMGGTESSTNRRRSATEDATVEDWLGSNRDPDVLLSVPDLGVDKITLSVEDLVADVDLHARVLDIVDLHVGAHVTLAKVELDVENVHAQAMLKVNLDKIADIVHRVLQSVDTHPELLVGQGTPDARAPRTGGGVRRRLREVRRRPVTADPAPVQAVHAVEYDAQAIPQGPAGEVPDPAPADAGGHRGRPARPRKR